MSVKTFFAKVEAEAKKLFGSTTWEKTVTSVVTYTAPIAETLIGLAAGQPAEALVAEGVTILKSDLATVSAVVSGATTTPSATGLATVVSALNSIKTNLSGLLTAAEVKNSKTSSAITSTVNLIVGEMDAALANVPSASVAAPVVAAPVVVTASK